MKKETRVTHQPKINLPEGNEPLVDPVYRTVKFTYPTIDAALTAEARRDGFDYTRDSNPTTRQLERLSSPISSARTTRSASPRVWRRYGYLSWRI